MLNTRLVIPIVAAALWAADGQAQKTIACAAGASKIQQFRQAPFRS